MFVSPVFADKAEKHPLLLLLPVMFLINLRPIVPTPANVIIRCPLPSDFTPNQYQQVMYN